MHVKNTDSLTTLNLWGSFRICNLSQEHWMHRMGHIWHIYIHIHIKGQFKLARPPICKFLLSGRKPQGEHVKLHTDSNLRSGSNWWPWSCEVITQPTVPVKILIMEKNCDAGGLLLSPLGFRLSQNICVFECVGNRGFLDVPQSAGLWVGDSPLAS